MITAALVVAAELASIHIMRDDAVPALGRSITRQKRWSAPFFWAGFTLQGDWR